MPLDIKAPPEEVTKRIVEHDLRNCARKLRRTVERMCANPSLFKKDARVEVHWIASRLATLASQLEESGTT